MIYYEFAYFMLLYVYNVIIFEFETIS